MRYYSLHIIYETEQALRWQLIEKSRQPLHNQVRVNFTNGMRSYREASQKMEDLLFSVGGAERIVKTLRYFKDRKVVQEVNRVRDTIDADKADKKKPKEGRLQSVVMDGLRNFLGMFHRPRGKDNMG